MIRMEVSHFVEIGPLPPENDSSPDQIEAAEKALFAIRRPVSDAEAALLATAFGPDGCFGLAQTLVGLIETAPSPLAHPSFPTGNNIWLVDLRERAARAASAFTDTGSRTKT